MSSATVNLKALSRPEPNSFANVDAVRVKHLQWNAVVDMSGKRIAADAVLHCVAAQPSVRTLVLDTSFLAIHKVVDDATDTELATTLQPRHDKFGSALHVSLPANALTSVGDVTKVRISYATTPECTALQWLTPSQTVGKTHPYMFSQCQAIHARSLVPIQDTPAVKLTYSATVTVPKPLTALMSAVPTTSTAGDGSAATTTFTFEQHTAIPVTLRRLYFCILVTYFPAS